MTDRPQHIRIFVSSPGDVAEERVLAARLIRRLAEEYADRAWVEPVFCEHEPLLLAAGGCLEGVDLWTRPATGRHGGADWRSRVRVEARWGL